MTRLAVALLLLALLTVPPGAGAQQAKVARIGVLRPLAPPDPNLNAFRQGLRELGYVEGQNIAIETRFAEGKRDRLPTLAKELVTLKVDVIVTATTPAIQAARQATGTIPIVTVSADPVGTGLVAGLARPGGNITGLSMASPEISGKQLELVRETVPTVKRVALLWDPANPAMPLRLRELEVAARTLGLHAESLAAGTPNELERALESATSKRADALIVPPTIANAYRRLIVDFASRNRLPAAAR
jgi:putative tryptophan/tyrosine transport system substrate-binding protein